MDEIHTEDMKGECLPHSSEVRYDKYEHFPSNVPTHEQCIHGILQR
jgi:hypothetical protein